MSNESVFQARRETPIRSGATRDSVTSTPVMCRSSRLVISAVRAAKGSNPLITLSLIGKVACRIHPVNGFILNLSDWWPVKSDEPHYERRRLPAKNPLLAPIRFRGMGRETAGGAPTADRHSCV